ncbi:MAG: glycerophosphodiester phosphodiesterase [Eubacterium coprostanoligenes]|uniref:Glycerophosphoryl diester phosphodiesterase n=1 Tax=Eubacterium coprostanoligenes TaxID=290054 RepID=A0A1T4JU05_9FIRM|nr:glycerophosphodiester phosphodiesterase [Eubacterium coprostanoligenes]MCI6360633.1 glycerophosphodiester phosphodiesterase [Eubacterium coprostanoligenes]MDD6664833.1 glycerophosphodiester phosphodiesterase [Eubacterium coprostanoligenes]MDD7358574.1 glycerophosphodiester phosphodiesterase [Eubacterium coprostanoligenes]MDY4698346.1 glycerophosphodiester phosphodiesterase [Eubacterium coprostanoligenes]SJZ33594.1 Glycerophosphoryl diester phosphodiesterase [Eubacterium coprostanoligenes]
MAKTAKNKKRIEKFKRFLKRNMTPTWAKRFAYQVVAFLVSVSMLVMVVSYAFNKTFDEHDLKFVDGFTITAHTGAYNTPDNSMESLEKAIEHGDASFEIEVRQRPNGTIVMSNDIINTNSDGTEITAAFQRVKKTDMHLNLDIRETRVLKNLHDLIVDYSLTDRVTLTGIEVFQANKVKENCPGVEYYVNYMPSRINIFTEDYQQKIIDMLEKTGAIGINCNYKYASRTLSNLLHKNGYKLSIWTVDGKYQIKRALVNTADNITTNNPQKVQHIINKWGK